MDWSDLPPELLTLITTFFTKNSDYIRFRAVCSPWRRAAPRRPRPGLPAQLPLLILEAARVFGPETNRRVDNIPLLWEVMDSNCRASSHGLLALHDKARHLVALFNPVTRSKIMTLPSLPQTISKIISSALPTPQRGHRFFVAAATISGAMLFWRPGYTAWVPVRETDGQICDITYHKQQLYALNTSPPLLMVWDRPTSYPTATLTLIGGGPPDQSFSTSRESKRYLVESDDELLIVNRILLQNYYYPNVRTEGFEVYKVECLLDEEAAVSKVEGLEDRALFVGDDNSYSVDTKASSCVNVKANCIYFVDFYDSQHVVKVYHLADNLIRLLVSFNKFKGVEKASQSWFVPSLC
ncbi:F-box protein At2g26160-like [Typha angustifolia]|uniref:F-box protein At2g26160-like n=1 Tax=Typha angustifolia TaxID=59011 RepID=UPI003C2E3A5C